MVNIIPGLIVRHYEIARLSPQAITRYARSRNKYVRVGIASRFDVPVEVLKELARDAELTVVCQAAYNDDLDTETLDHIADRLKGMEPPVDAPRYLLPEILLAVVNNPNCSIETVWKITEPITDAVSRRIFTARLIRFSEDTLRGFAEKLELPAEIVHSSDLGETISHMVNLKNH